MAARSELSASASPPEVRKCKLVFLGDQAVGKTSIITRFIYDTFDQAYQPTIGIDFVTKTLQTPTCSVVLQLWDTAGQERFWSLIPSYIRDSAVAVVVYDVTRRATFQNTIKWLEDARNERRDDVLLCLVANKIDLTDTAEVSADSGRTQASAYDATFIETSAKSGFNVRVLFREIVKHLAAATPGVLPLAATAAAYHDTGASGSVVRTVELSSSSHGPGGDDSSPSADMHAAAPRWRCAC